MRHLKTIISTVILLFSINITVTATELSEPVQMNSINENDSIEMKSFNSGLGIETHTEQEIRQFIQNNNVFPLEPTIYGEKPSKQIPYSPGSLSTDTLTNTLKVLNNIRYIAGLNANITLNEEYNQMAQAASLINCINNSLEHTPAKPEGMDNTLYNLGYKGASSSNIAYGESSIKEIMMLYMVDIGNFETMGHRRWILNPPMAQTGFGQVEKYNTMYVFDGNNKETQTNIAWPASEMPLEYFYNSDNEKTNTPWTLSTGNIEDINKINVTLTKLSNNQTWTFNNTSSDGYFNVNNQSFGITGCIIFKPDNITYANDDKFHVTITGTTNGTIEYDVHFFELNLPVNPITISIDKTIVTIEKEKSIDIPISITPEKYPLDPEYIELYSYDESIAYATYTQTQNNKGLITITGVNPGDIEILVSSKNYDFLNEMIYVSVVENADITDISINKTDITIPKDGQKKVIVTITPDTYNLNNTLISVSDKNIVSVTYMVNTMVISGKNPGTATVTISNQNKTVSKTINVTVTDTTTPTPDPDPDPDPTPDPQPTPVVVETYDSYITNLEPATLKSNTTVTKWTSSSPSIVTIKKSGKKSCSVTGNALGTATITGYNNNNTVVIYNVTVEIPKLNAQSLRKKNTYNVNDWISGLSNCKPTRFESSDTKILKVNKNTGEVKALKKGKAKITVYFGTGKISKKYTVK